MADRLHKDRFVTTHDIEDQAGSGYLSEKRDFYLRNKDRYDILYLGDSRTLCGLHPDSLEPYVGLKGFTLAHWSNWLPTQYALLNDIIDDIPSDTVIVWSIGEENFSLSPIEEIYPIGWRNMPYLIKAGYPPGDIVNNLLYYAPPTAAVGQNVRIFNFFDTVILPYPLKNFSNASMLAIEESVTSATGGTQDEQLLLQKFRNEKGVGYIRPWYDNGKLVSIAQYKTNGAALRTEITPEYYRARQTELPRTEISDNIHFNPTAWQIFTDILDMFKERGMTVIVNEMDLTPRRYISPEDHWKTQSILREKVIPVVESYGFDYVHADYTKFTDEDYFDYNHMNAEGVKKFSADVGPKLKAVLDKGDHAL